MKESTKRNRSVREYLDDDDLNDLDRKLREPRRAIHLKSRYAEEHGGTATRQQQDPDFQWTADHRLNRRRRVQTKSVFEDELTSKKQHMEKKRAEHTRNLIRDLFKDNFLSRQDRDKLTKKMQSEEFLKDIYILDQALGGAPDYKKKIAKHIKKQIE